MSSQTHEINQSCSPAGLVADRSAVNGTEAFCDSGSPRFLLPDDVGAFAAARLYHAALP